MSRPKSDRATVVSTIIALLALGWGVYAYYFPPAAPAPPAAATTPAAGAATSSTPSPSAEPGPSDSVPRALKAIPAAFERFSQRAERDRYKQSWWELALAWLFLMGFLVWRSIEYFDRAIWVPLFGAGFIYYFWPSLSWWGVTASTIGGLIAWAIAGLGSAGAFEPQPGTHTQASASDRSKQQPDQEVQQNLQDQQRGGAAGFREH
ncbi:hypothetical protein [Micromonospora polyrhachis]|uniref:Uncharacterized protein n=1 Tax=Micromonospora polyrhachis TaxID=1282883 RepID=A0A7W7SV71_9ACTN|nr:hypothetical protein [Micromonospora polyrhachis]MBB4960255.1 hypothetical protein [Micromonospora polyrhachis]